MLGAEPTRAFSPFTLPKRCPLELPQMGADSVLVPLHALSARLRWRTMHQRDWACRSHSLQHCAQRWRPGESSPKESIEVPHKAACEPLHVVTCDYELTQRVLCSISPHAMHARSLRTVGGWPYSMAISFLIHVASQGIGWKFSVAGFMSNPTLSVPKFILLLAVSPTIG